ncbi:hypothetical protein BDR07DRAFT_1305939 [Suillus spraguei]|nr:hypothetical protein BDR07DRAFT_1305939 [Suillus spraguei]
MPPRKKTQAAGGQEPEPKDRCFWMPDDDNRLIDFIEANRSRAGDGINFDKMFWTEAATYLAESTTQGAVKTGEACSSKWSWLRVTFDIVDRVANHSGVAWDQYCGADITTESEMVWADIVKATPSAKPYKTKGWLPYERLKNILPSKEKGTNVYHPLHPPISTATAGMSFEEVEIQHSEAVLDEMESGFNNLDVVDVLMPPPLPPFNAALQLPFTPSMPGTSSAAGKQKANGDDSMRTLVCPPTSTKGKGTVARKVTLTVKTPFSTSVSLLSAAATEELPL